MQAPPSFTASGEHLLSALSSSPSLRPMDVSQSIYPKRASFVPVFQHGLSYIPNAARESEVAEGIGLAHDAGNLLGAIRLYCDLLALPGVLRSEHRHYADELRQLTARSGSLIGRLLHPGGASAASDRVKTATERVAVAEAVVACRGMLDGIAAPGSLLIAVEAGATGKVAMPREALERILVNLTKNAAEAGRGDALASRGAVGSIALRVRSVAAWGPEQRAGISWCVEDRGRGMNEAELQAALTGQPVAHSQTAATRPGRGLGLRVVRELTAGTGGELRMRSRPGQGTSVEIVWPVCAEVCASDGVGAG